MNAKTETSGPGALDVVKILLAVGLIVAGVAGYYYFPDASTALRAAGIVLAVALAIGIFFTTVQGQELWRFITASRVELRKVVWPTKQETVQTAIAVIIFTLILAIFFWVLDKFLFWATRLLTGQGG
jgi:preprotein translocase subunit SecE